MNFPHWGAELQPNPRFENSLQRRQVTNPVRSSCNLIIVQDELTKFQSKKFSENDIYAAIEEDCLELEKKWEVTEAQFLQKKAKPLLKIIRQPSTDYFTFTGPTSRKPEKAEKWGVVSEDCQSLGTQEKPLIFSRTLKKLVPVREFEYRYCWLDRDDKFLEWAGDKQKSNLTPRPTQEPIIAPVYSSQIPRPNQVFLENPSPFHALDLLNFLEKTQKLPLCQGNQEAIKTAVSQYLSFLRLKHKDKSVIPTPEVEIVWISHLLRPAAYQMHCKLLFGETVPHTFDDLNKSLLQQALPQMAAESVSELNETLMTAVEKDSKWFGHLKDYFDDFRIPYPPTLDYLESNLELYARFWHLAQNYVRNPTAEMLSPPLIIDIFWHSHMLTNIEYQRDCLVFFGKTLVHDPWPQRWENKENRIADTNEFGKRWKTQFLESLENRLQIQTTVGSIPDDFDYRFLIDICLIVGPQTTCKMASVCKKWRTYALSDMVWKSFLEKKRAEIQPGPSIIQYPISLNPPAQLTSVTPNLSSAIWWKPLTNEKSLYHAYIIRNYEVELNKHRTRTDSPRPPPPNPYQTQYHHVCGISQDEKSQFQESGCCHSVVNEIVSEVWKMTNATQIFQFEEEEKLKNELAQRISLETMDHGRTREELMWVVVDQVSELVHSH